jgi:hypothetical protein
MTLRQTVTQVFFATALSVALAACNTAPPNPPPTSSVPAPAPAPEPVSAPEPPPPAGPTPEEIKAKALAQRREAQQLAQDIEDETRRLTSYQKNLFQVFKLTETFAGFKAKPNAVGVFESKSSKTGKLRVALAQLPDSPARLNVGSYTVNLDVLVEYVEMRECIAGGCVGKIQKIVRSVTRPVQISISPKSGFAGNREVSYVDTKDAEPNAKNYRISYSDLVMTVRRMAVTPG